MLIVTLSIFFYQYLLKTLHILKIIDIDIFIVKKTIVEHIKIKKKQVCLILYVFKTVIQVIISNVGVKFFH